MGFVDVRIDGDVEEADHHLIGALLAPVDFGGGIRVAGIRG